MAKARLPLFPLGLVLLPGELVPLHIFEPRYKEMIQVCLDTDKPFGIVYASESALSGVGTTARLHKVVTRYDDGRLDIIAVGEQRFRVGEVSRDLAYLASDFEMLEDEANSGAGTHSVRSKVIARHLKLLELAGEQIAMELYEDIPNLSFLVGRNAGLDLAAKQSLLEMRAESARLAFLATHLEQLLLRVRKAKSINDLARGDGHVSVPPSMDPPPSQ